ncbi:MAG: hypothetical protein U0802_14670 [Candidatus Binatia bacterium]
MERVGCRVHVRRQRAEGADGAAEVIVVRLDGGDDEADAIAQAAHYVEVHALGAADGEKQEDHEHGRQRRQDRRQGERAIDRGDQGCAPASAGGSPTT